MQPKIVVVGSANTDMVVQVSHLPAPGETVLGGAYVQTLGGKGANQAVAAARLGAQVTFVARLGSDAFGQESLAAYASDGIDTRYIVRDAIAPSGVALILVNPLGENVIAVAPGANALLSPQDVQAAEEAIRRADCLLVQLEISLSAVEAAIRLAAQHAVPVIVNPAPAAELPDSVCSLVDYLTPNETEAAFLVGAAVGEREEQWINRLHHKFPKANIVVTQGKRGALILGEVNKLVPSFTVNAVDAIGAGDAFNAGLAVAVAKGEDTIAAVRFANAVAALSTTRPGAQTAMPRLEEVHALLHQA